MRKVLFGVAAAIGMLSLMTPVSALPRLATPTVEPVELPIVLAATAYQKSAARASCRRQYGSRLTDVKFKGNNYYCIYKPSLKRLSKNAAKTCAKRGQRLVKFTAIKYGKRVTTTRFLCR